MLRALRLLAAISFAWMVVLYLVRAMGVGDGPAVSFLSVLGGELGFAVGFLALVVTASRRQVAWCALFALLVALLHVLPLFVFRAPPYPNFLGLFEAPLELFVHPWVVLLPTLIPGMAYIYTLITWEGRPVIDEETSSSLPS